MGQIIAIQGKGNTGKTTTINILETILISQGYTQRGYYHRSGKEFTGVFQKENKKVGLTSAGDNYHLLHPELVTLINTSNCDIVVCACRTHQKSIKGNPPKGSISAVKSFSATHPAIFEPKTIATNTNIENICNDYDAYKVFLLT